MAAIVETELLTSSFWVFCLKNTVIFTFSLRVKELLKSFVPTMYVEPKATIPIKIEIIVTKAILLVDLRIRKVFLKT